MIFESAHVPAGAVIDTDVCVVGCGAGGSMVAMTCAEAGRRVLVIEPGPFLTPADMSQREEEMFGKLLWHGGARTGVERSVKVHQGKGVGGSTLHNLNLCKRIPAAILEQWLDEHGLAHLAMDVWDRLYAEVEGLLQVTEVPRERWNRHNQLLEQACRELGWRGAGLSHNRTGCAGSGFCEIGCAFDAKNNGAKVLIPRAVAAGAEVVVRAQVIEMIHRDGQVESLRVAALDEDGQAAHEFTVTAERVCLCASATGTPAVLLRSDVPDESDLTGQRLRIHPAVVAAGEFDDDVMAWQGIPQTYECTEWLDFEGEGRRIWIVPAFAHPMATATMLPGHGAGHRRLMEAYPRLAVLTAMVHDGTAGTVEPRGDLDVRIRYWPDESDRRQLAIGLAACSELLFAAGARRVFVPTTPVRELSDRREASELTQLQLEKGTMDITGVHPMSSVPMGDDPARSVVDSRGKHHQMDNLWVGDGSLFPTSIGGPPQLSIYAMGLHVGRAVAAG